MMQQHRIRIGLPNTAVVPKNRRKCMVSRDLGLLHVHREHDAALTKPGHIFFIFAHHVTRVGPITIA